MIKDSDKKLIKKVSKVFHHTWVKGHLLVFFMNTQPIRNVSQISYLKYKEPPKEYLQVY